jgi:hypothetical protein
MAETDKTEQFSGHAGKLINSSVVGDCGKAR